MTANDTKSYLFYLNKLVDEYNNTLRSFYEKELLLRNHNPDGKYWSPGRPEDVPLQRPQDVP